jgi:hypothetical protein
MKHLMRMLTLIMPCVPMVAAASATAAGLQAQAQAKSGPDQARRHQQLIKVKFVLVRPPSKPQEGQHFDFGSQSTVRSSPSWDRYATPLSRDYMKPNMYWCSGWECRDLQH